MPARCRTGDRNAVAELTAAAVCARDTALAVSVVLPRAPGIVAHARAVAEAAAVLVTATIKVNTVCLRFTPGPGGAVPAPPDPGTRPALRRTRGAVAQP
jgi:hypothetical protein